MVPTISRDELKEKLDRGDDFVLVETLSEDRLRHSYLPTAINIPPDRIAALAPEPVPDGARTCRIPASPEPIGRL